MQSYVRDSFVRIEGQKENWQESQNDYKLGFSSRIFFCSSNFLMRWRIKHLLSAQLIVHASNST